MMKPAASHQQHFAKASSSAEHTSENLFAPHTPLSSYIPACLFHPLRAAPLSARALYERAYHSQIVIQTKSGECEWKLPLKTFCRDFCKHPTRFLIGVIFMPIFKHFHFSFPIIIHLIHKFCECATCWYKIVKKLCVIELKFLDILMNKV